MQIHIVQPGDTFYSLSKYYDIPLQSIVDLNNFTSNQYLIPGQSLLIPIDGTVHSVVPGDTLYNIAQFYRVPINSILKANNISSEQPLYIGSKLIIPSTNKAAFNSSAYIDLSITNKDAPFLIDQVSEPLTSLNIFSYEVNEDGTLSPLFDEESLDAAYDGNVDPIMVISNLRDGQFSTELATTILSNPKLQDVLLNNVLDIIKQKGYVGLDVDFEYLGKENKQRYLDFLTKAKRAVKSVNPQYKLSVAVPPKTSPDMIGRLYEGHDYAGIGEIADNVLLMTYEWGYSAGPPLAVSPLNKVEEVLEYAVSKIPRQKILLGNPLYGYDWTLPYVAGSSFANALDEVRALELAAKYGSIIEYDETYETPYFFYYDNQGRKHEVWFDDARSYQAKFDLVKEFDLAGFYAWQLGFNSPSYWLLLDDNFTVIKN